MIIDKDINNCKPEIVQSGVSIGNLGSNNIFNDVIVNYP